MFRAAELLGVEAALLDLVGSDVALLLEADKVEARDGGDADGDGDGHGTSGQPLNP
jgi:hypothetical protein